MGAADEENRLGSAVATDTSAMNSKREPNPHSTSITGERTAPNDLDVVDWDGPDDPANPMNWPTSKKIITAALVSMITFVTYAVSWNHCCNFVISAWLIFPSPLASSIFAPSIEQVMTEFKSTNKELASFIVSVYLLGYFFGPLVIAPLSEMYGRLILYNICNVLFVIWNAACALSPNLGALIVFRFLAGLAGC